ncbi:MAG: ABC transporter ATP-binding protein [Clostridia bacterium]
MKNKTLKRAYDLIKPHQKTIIIVTLISLVITICELIKPYLMKIVIDEYLSAGIFVKAGVTIGMIGAIYIGIVLFGNILNFITKTITNIMGENVVRDLRNRLFRFVEHANVRFYDKTSTGKIFVRITNDVEDIASLFKDVITTSIKDIILIVALLAMMIYLSIQLSMLAFVIIPFILVSSYLISKTLHKVYGISKNIRTSLNTFLAESIYGIKLIKIFDRKKEKQKECNKLTSDLFESRKITGILEGLLPAIMLILQNVGISIIIVAFTNRWFNIVLDVGLIYLFVTYIKQIFDPINNIIENIEVIQESVVSINKIYEMLEKEKYLEELNDGKQLVRVKGKIEFKNVWFAYDKKNWVLKDISFVINPKESVALVGKTGSGKTTITNLINRFYEIQKGEILLDGVNIKEYTLNSLRRKIGIILQEPFIFARSIKDNVRLNSDISDRVVKGALKLSHSQEIIDKLPNGIEEIALESGSSFSSGEKQLISFARIFAHDPKIFILDEATANVDTHTEQLIQKAVDIISKDKTSIFIAHRLSTIVNVDKIFVLDKGVIIEEGNHCKLLKQGGYYAELYNAYYTSLDATN